MRFYDKMGLLCPAERTESGYRVYRDTDFERLQQILALKFLGFSLAEIKLFLSASPLELRDALEQQHAMLRERRLQLETVLQAVDSARAAIDSDGQRWDSVVSVIRAIQMTEQHEWHKKYFTAEQLKAMEQLRKESYSPEAEAALAERRTWTEEDQRRVDAQYAAVWDGVRRAHAAGETPDGPRAQELAGQAIGLIEAFTGGNPAVAAGLEVLWDKMESMPPELRPVQIPLSDEESNFLEQAKAIYRGRRG